MKRVLILLCVIGLLCGVTACSKSGPVTVYDTTGAVIATLSRSDFPDSEITQTSYRSYIELALSEAVSVLSATYHCDATEAAEKLFQGGYDLHTTLDPTAHAAVDTMYANYAAQNLPLGCAILDSSGSIRAVYSGGDASYALIKHPPFSTIKPLAVYAPAVESGLIDWSSKLTDSPYKQITNEAGEFQEWPTNPNGKYTYSKISLTECIKQSLNTTAVHCLKSVGVEKAIRFLQTSFAMDLTYEQNKLAAAGEDEVIGNVALGYLYSGVTPVDLAGYYQVFANGGQYTRPFTITEITDGHDRSIYVHQSETKQVITADTAYIMNRLLREVVSAGGTGAKARVDGTELIGKTGTGSDDGGNWFVGVTPEYSCAVWHGVSKETGNAAAALFTDIMANMPKPTVTQFAPCATVQEGVYCSESGNLFSSSCSRMYVGYYASDRKPPVCDAHQ